MNLETLIRICRGQWGAFAWLALGVLLPVFILLGFSTLTAVLRGRLGSGSARFFAEQRVIAEWLRKR